MMTKIEVDYRAGKMQDRYTDAELWDRYKAAKLMDDKDEVRIFRKAIALKTGKAPR